MTCDRWARAFTKNWDLLEPRVLATPAPDLPAVEVEGLIAEACRLAGLRGHCTDDGDRFLARLDALAGWAARLETAVDDPARIGFLAEAATLKWGYRQRPNWTRYGLECLKGECVEVAARAAALRAGVVDAALRRLADRIAAATLEAARERRAEGQLEFHDLLVLARDLLSSPVHGAAVRTSLQRRYRRLLLDEFQDTDPIQVELAVRIAAGAAGGAAGWEDVPVPEGSLFLVGDPKQSIYRFRRADVATYLEAQQRIGARLVLQANFRTTKPVLAWINHVFGQLVTAEPGAQPPYHGQAGRRADGLP